MQTTEVELKAIAKAVGSSLTRAGHPVPHSTVLHALAAALNKRDWHALKAALEAGSATARPTEEVVGPGPVVPSYSERTWFFLRLAKALGRPLTELPEDDERALNQAVASCGAELSGVLHWGGWSLPATLTLKTALIDAGAFRPARATAGRLSVTLRDLGVIDLETGYSSADGWFVSKGGSAEFYAQLEKRVSKKDVLAAANRGVTNFPDLVGPVVKAEFWTDDRKFEVEFDARPYLMHAPDKALVSIIEVGYVGDSCTDAVAEYVADKGLDEDLTEAFIYLGALQKSRLKEPVGFECEVDEETFLRWMDEQRPQVLAKVLCDRAGVRLVEAQEPEVAGRWNWLDDQGNASDASLESEAEAALDAYRKLDLLEQALADEL